MSGSEPVEFFRVAVTLEVAERVDLHADHAAVIYALTGEANGLARGEPAFMPDGVMVDAPERCRTVLRAHEAYRFGWTMCLGDAREAARLLEFLARGLQQVGMAAPTGKKPLYGNFEVLEIRDLVSGHRLQSGDVPHAIPGARLDAETDALAELDVCTIRCTTPLRMPRPQALKQPGHAHVDGTWLDPNRFVGGVHRRLRQLGWNVGVPPESAVELLSNDLVWLDLAYGGGRQAKTLGGACGSFTVRLHDRSVCRALVLGQYARIGQNSRFGFGAYRIQELGEDPTVIDRSALLLDLALDGTGFDRAVDRYDLPSGSARRLRSMVRHGHYRPETCVRVPIPKGGRGLRTLSIPSRRDRAMQRAVAEVISPGLDKFFEESSLAYRRGLGRRRAATMVRRAYTQGYTWALRADFERFFDRIPHERLEHRLRASLADDVTSSLIMDWVRAGSPLPDHGIPTGSPLSPVLANLFLDRFDELVEADGGRLVRYADDFMILFRSEEEAIAMHARVEQLARSLELSLNEEKSRLEDLKEPFTFLGFRFERTGQWSARPVHAPCRVEELGWTQATRPAPSVVDSIRLPGEGEGTNGPAEAAFVILAETKAIDMSSRELIATHEDGASERRLSLRRIRDVVVLGQPEIRPGVFRQLSKSGIRIQVVDPSARHTTDICPRDRREPAQTFVAQVAACAEPRWRFAIAKRLIRAKIMNHAVLAQTLRERLPDDHVAVALRDASGRLDESSSFDALRGMEGAAAACWYHAFGRLLPSWCEFPGRRAPDAEDPANILLNLGQTMLHRHVEAALDRVGLVTSLGVLHEPRPGHASLASDHQEPFRHLVDRTVLDLMAVMQPRDFRRNRPGSAYPVDLAPRALHQAIRSFHELLTLPCRRGHETKTYLEWIASAARTFKGHVLDRAQVFDVFQHDA